MRLEGLIGLCVPLLLTPRIFISYAWANVPIDIPSDVRARKAEAIRASKERAGDQADQGHHRQPTRP